MEQQYIPLVSGTKAPAVAGWNQPDYQCSKDEALDRSKWVGLRCDDLVVVDCDTPEAGVDWERQTQVATYSIKTPRGVHYYYRAGPGSPTGPAVGVRDKVDIRAGKGSYVVVPPTPGYKRVSPGLAAPAAFDPAWVPSLTRAEPPAGQVDPGPLAGWSKIPEGRRDVTLAAFAGALRKQGMNVASMYAVLRGMNDALCDPPLDDTDVRRIAKSIARFDAEPDPVVRLVDDPVEPRLLTLVSASSLGPPPPKTWLWDPYIPDNTLTLVSGREGIGKGLFCAFAAVGIVTGAVPGTGEKVAPRPVLWMAAEDAIHDDIWPRLRAAGWDPGNPDHADIEFLDQSDPFTLPRDRFSFARTVKELQPGLIIMDPGRAYFSREDGRGMSYNDEADIRPPLQQCLRVASEYRVPVLFVAHWKKGQGPSKDQTSGSIAWKQVARHCLDFAESVDETEHAFAIGKSNLGRKGAVRGYSIETVPEFDSARFVLEDPLSFTTLDKWLDSVKDEAKVSIDIDLLTDVLEGLPWGAAVPAREELMHRTGLSQTKVRKLLQHLITEGRITVTPGQPNRWQR